MRLSEKSKIGHGCHSRVYDQGNGTVIVKSRDKTKLSMAKGLFPKHRLFPTVEMIGERQQNGDMYGLFRMEKYEYILNQMNDDAIREMLSKRQYRFYCLLERINSISGEVDRIKTRLGEKFPKEFHRELKAIYDAIDGMASEGIYADFESQDFNLAIKGNKIVLLDCFFPRSNGKGYGDISKPKKVK
jgi:hypothetical protein